MNKLDPGEQMRAAKAVLEQRVSQLNEQISAAELNLERLKQELYREQETLDTISRYLSSDAAVTSQSAAMVKNGKNLPIAKRVVAKGRTLPRHPVLDRIYPYLSKSGDGAHHSDILEYLQLHKVHLNGLDASSTLQGYLNRAVGWGSLERSGRGRFALHPEARFEFE